MDRHAQKVFIAVALGIGLGILTGRAIGGPIAWLLGALIGGGSAYVLFAPIAAIRAIPAAYRAARGWRLTSEQWELFRWHLWAVLAVFTSVLAAVFTLAWFDKDPKYIEMLYDWVRIGELTLIFGLIAGLCTLALADVRVPPDDWFIRRGHGHMERELEILRFIAMNALLPVLLFWHLPRSLWWIATVAIPAIAVFAVRFGKQWFVLIHSDLRTLCLADAFLFAGIGILVGGPILAWMVGGGAFGVLNYQVVSLRILKLRPVRSAE